MMLMTTIEIWPFGDKKASWTLATLKIANVTPEPDHQIADYAVVCGSKEEKLWRHAKDFPQCKEAALLVKLALTTCGQQQ